MNRKLSSIYQIALCILTIAIFASPAGAWEDPEEQKSSSKSLVKSSSFAGSDSPKQRLLKSSSSSSYNGNNSQRTETVRLDDELKRDVISFCESPDDASDLGEVATSSYYSIGPNSSLYSEQSSLENSVVNSQTMYE